MDRKIARIMYNYVKWGDWLTSSDYTMQFYTDCGNNKQNFKYYPLFSTNLCLRLAMSVS